MWVSKNLKNENISAFVMNLIVQLLRINWLVQLLTCSCYKLFVTTKPIGSYIQHSCYNWFDWYIYSDCLPSSKSDSFTFVGITPSFNVISRDLAPEKLKFCKTYGYKEAQRAWMSHLLLNATISNVSVSQK